MLNHVDVAHMASRYYYYTEASLVSSECLESPLLAVDIAGEIAASATGGRSSECPYAAYRFQAEHCSLEMSLRRIVLATAADMMRTDFLEWSATADEYRTDSSGDCDWEAGAVAAVGAAMAFAVHTAAAAMLLDSDKDYDCRTFCQTTTRILLT